MGFKVRVEIDPECDEEIIIRCRNVSDEIARIESLVSSIDPCEMELELGNDLYFVKTERILFFETDGSKTAAHTVTECITPILSFTSLRSVFPKALCGSQSPA